jgi:two-component system phosphate regulon response regulator PhoB
MLKSKILVIEEDRSLADLLEYNLTNSGYEVFCAYDGQSGLNQARSKNPDLIILDAVLPVVDGVEVCRELRAVAATRETPIMMLTTAKSDETDPLVEYSLGADDYVEKPFSVRVLMERMKSLLRRRDRNLGGADVVNIGRVAVDRIKHQASVDQKPIDLTPSEFRLLDTMMRQPGRAFDRTELIDLALGTDAMVLERTIDVHIRSLRKKMGDVANTVETVRGIGYRFRESRDEEK